MIKGEGRVRGKSTTSALPPLFLLIPDDDLIVKMEKLKLIIMNYD